MKSIKNIYIDTNILVNYCTGIGNGKVELTYILKHREKNKLNLYTSTLALVQTISQIQTENKYNNRLAFSKAETTHYVRDVLIKKLNILDLSFSNIKNSFKEKNEDVEDNVHYQILKEAGCDTILTGNKEDFNAFKDIEKLEPIIGIIRTRIR